MAEPQRYLQNLNSSQRQVATRPDGHLLVLAGPGAGKTRALTARIGHLLIARQIPAREITAITFSRRAGAELRERVATMLASGVTKAIHSGDATEDTARRPAVWAGTFHAFGARILRAGGARAFGRTRDFSIYDDDDTERTVRRVLNTLGVRSGSARESDTGTEANETSRTRSDVVANTIRAISLLKRTAGGLPNKATASDEMDAIFAAYEQELAQANAFDFDDLVSLSALALGADDELLGRVRARTRHLLIDEFQDTDPAQERLIAQLNAPDLCVVADPEQSIYAFRGTSPLVVERFLDTWHPATIIRLEQNYRSTRRIVAVAQRLRDASPASAVTEAQSTARDASSRNQPPRLRLWTENAVGDQIRFWTTNHPDREASLIVADIEKRLRDGCPPEEIAILTRTHAQMRPIEAALLKVTDLPFVIVGGVAFFGREEVRDLMAYLRVARTDDDAAAFWRIINTPRRGLGPAMVIAIGREMLALDPSTRNPLCALRRLTADGRAPEGGYDLLALIDELRAQFASGSTLPNLVRSAIELTKYRDHLSSTHPDDARERGRRLDTLTELASRHSDLRLFLDEVVLSTQVDGPREDIGSVRLSTVHAAKGAEFDHVYLPGCEHGVFPLKYQPSQAGSDDLVSAFMASENPGPAHLAEERRVFYVGTTRARNTLTLSACTFRQNRRAAPSRFLTEIGSDLLVRCDPGTSNPVPIPSSTVQRTSERSSRPGSDLPQT